MVGRASDYYEEYRVDRDESDDGNGGGDDLHGNPEAQAPGLTAAVMPVGDDRQTSGPGTPTRAPSAVPPARAWIGRTSDEPVVVQLGVSGVVRVCHPQSGWHTLNQTGNGELYARLLGLHECDDPVVVLTVEEEARSGLN